MRVRLRFVLAIGNCVWLLVGCTVTQPSTAHIDLFGQEIDGVRFLISATRPRIVYALELTEPLPTTVTLDTPSGSTQVVSHACAQPSDFEHGPCIISDSLQTPPIGVESSLSLRIDRADSSTERSAIFVVRDGTMHIRAR